MRYYLITVIMIFSLLLTSCGGESERDRLAYQNAKLRVEAAFTLDGEAVPAKLILEAPEYDETGRMLARDAVLTLGENSIISGVSFEFSHGEVYVSSGVLKIPIEDDSVIDGISDIISLFCISDDCYYSSEETTVGGIECERAVYIDGDNRVEVILDLSCMLPISISATIDGRELAAEIKLIKAE